MNRHDNRAGTDIISLIQSPTPTPQHILYPISNGLKFNLLSHPLRVGYRVSSIPSRTRFKLEK